MLYTTMLTVFLAANGLATLGYLFMTLIELNMIVTR